MYKTTIYIFIVIQIQCVWCAKEDEAYIIVGGDFTKISKYPHSAYIYTSCNGPSECGASLLNQVIFLTAAHCLDSCILWRKTKHKVSVYMGASVVKHMHIHREIVHFKLHGDYNEETLENDIALAIVRRDIPLEKNAKRVVIPRRFPPMSIAAHGYVAGFGAVGPNEIEVWHLKHVYQMLRSKKECASKESAMTGKFCAGNIRRKIDYVSRGDSGNALVTEDKRYLQIGIVSHRVFTKIGITYFTNVTYFYSWIQSNSDIMYCQLKQAEGK